MPCNNCRNKKSTYLIIVSLYLSKIFQKSNPNESFEMSFLSKVLNKVSNIKKKKKKIQSIRFNAFKFFLIISRVNKLTYSKVFLVSNQVSSCYLQFKMKFGQLHPQSPRAENHAFTGKRSCVLGMP